MSQVQLMGLEAARNKMLRARKEFEAARLREVAYRGVHYDMPNRPEEETHGTFVYRGRTYTK
jgi:hypothetical protein|tara:strand:+ start:293 stop:478 length:186 start_codon:yes stop_codon:yes gene_type:complete